MELWVCFCFMLSFCDVPHCNGISFLVLYVPLCCRILLFLSVSSSYDRGFPIWLHFIPGIQFRTTNAPFKVHLFLSVEIISHNNCTNFKWFIFMPYELGNFPNCRVQNEMKQFLAKIVEMMKEEHLFASQGGPIILAQVFFFS